MSSSDSDSDSSFSLFPSSKRRSDLFERMLAVAKAPLSAPGTSVPSVQHLSLHEVDSGVVASEVYTLDSHSSAHDITHSGSVDCSQHNRQSEILESLDLSQSSHREENHAAFNATCRSQHEEDSDESIETCRSRKRCRTEMDPVAPGSSGAPVAELSDTELDNTSNGASNSRSRSSYQISYYANNRESINRRRQVRRSENRDAVNSSQLSYREENRDAVNSSQRSYREKNRDELNATRRSHREENRDEINATRRSHHEENRDAVNASLRSYREENRDAVNATRRSHHEENRDAVNATRRSHHEENRDTLNITRRAQRRRRADMTPEERETARARDRDLRESRARARLLSQVERAAIDINNRPAPYSVGLRDKRCVYGCGALLFEQELRRSSTCCNAGKTIIPTCSILQPYPTELHDLLTGWITDPHFDQYNFYECIRNYNSAFAFAAMNSHEDQLLVNTRGPYTFRVHGDIRFSVGTLRNHSQDLPVFSQCYLLEGSGALQSRLNNPRNTGCDKHLMSFIQRVLSTVMNPYKMRMCVCRKLRKIFLLIPPHRRASI